MVGWALDIPANASPSPLISWYTPPPGISMLSAFFQPNIDSRNRQDASGSVLASSVHATAFGGEAGLVLANTAMTAPTGSARTANRPVPGRSVPGTSTCPPSVPAFVQAASTSATD